MTDQTVTITPELTRQDGKGRVANTGAQAGAAGALVIVGNWAAHQVGWTGELPIEVAAAMQLLLTSAAAWWANRKKLRGESGQSLLVVVVGVVLAALLLRLLGVW